MARLLKVGDTVKTKFGVDVAITKLLSGKGGQGYVYIVKYGNETKVLKWYKTTFIKKMRDIQATVNGSKISADRAFYDNMAYNTTHRPRLLPDYFIWPLDYIEWNYSLDDSFGYIMDLIPTDTYKELTDFYMFKTRFKSRYEMLTACLNVIEGFRRLHLDGMSYQDINNGNIYIDPNTGNVLIADNDNVTTNGVNFGIGGKDRYMAPEVVLGNIPNKYTDRFSLAVILFRILMGAQHPLEGVHSEGNPESVSYGKDPVFIFDPADKRNAPTPQKHKNALIKWPEYPKYIQDLFIDVFGKKCITTPEARPIETIWIRDFIRLRGEIATCPHCEKAPVFLDVNGAVKCPNCKADVTVPCKLVSGNNVIPVVPRTNIYMCQLDSGCKDFDKKALRFLKSPQGNYAFGNFLDETIHVDYPDGTSISVASKDVAPFKLGMKIHIGGFTGEVCR